MIFREFPGLVGMELSPGPLQQQSTLETALCHKCQPRGCPGGDQCPVLPGRDVGERRWSKAGVPGLAGAPARRKSCCQIRN